MTVNVYYKQEGGPSVCQSCDQSKLTTLRVESRHLHLLYLHLTVVCVSLRLAVSVEDRLVNDGRTERQARRQLIPALAGLARVLAVVNDISTRTNTTLTVKCLFRIFAPVD